MTETIESVTLTDTILDEDAQRELVAQMVEQARAAGIDLVGPGGLLTPARRPAVRPCLKVPHLGGSDHRVVQADHSTARSRAASSFSNQLW